MRHSRHEGACPPIQFCCPRIVSCAVHLHIFVTLQKLHKPQTIQMVCLSSFYSSAYNIFTSYKVHCHMSFRRIIQQHAVKFKHLHRWWEYAHSLREYSKHDCNPAFRFRSSRGVFQVDFQSFTRWVIFRWAVVELTGWCKPSSVSFLLNHEGRFGKSIKPTTFSFIALQNTDNCT